MIRILIADNNTELCTTLQEFLAAQPDMEVVGVAYDGNTALRLIKECAPNCVLLDITMPHLDGMAVLERLPSLGLQHDPCVIVLSALAREDIIQRFMDLGAHYFINKPFDLGILAERIRQFTGEPSETYHQPAAADDETAVTRLLHEMGVPPHFKGYKYLRDAVLMMLHEEPIMQGTLTGYLYPRLAAKYHTTPGGVEAAIRNSVIAAWQNGNREFLSRLTGTGGARRKSFPTNSVVIAKLADEVRFSGRAG